MAAMFPDEVYLKRRKDFIEKLNAENLSAGIITDDLNRTYLSGFSGTAGWLFITADKGYILTDFRYAEQVREECKTLTPIIIKDTLTGSLKSLCSELSLSKIGFAAEYVTVKLLDMLRDEIKDVKWCRYKTVTDDLRVRKGEEELSVINKALEILKKIVEYVRGLNLVGKSEKEIVRLIENKISEYDGASPAFPTIVLSGVQSSRPHGKPSECLVKNGEAFLFDLGVKFKGYHTDMTRTLITGEPSEKFKKIYGIVEEAQKTAIKSIRQGVKCSDLHKSAQDIIDSHGYGEYFGHGLGHGLGLDIHERPYLNVRSDEVLEENTIVTVEPGIYIPGWGGVRIEDMVRVTKNGCKVLTDF